MNSFGEKLRQLRKSRKLSQSRVAAAIHTCTAAVCYYETGHRIPDAIKLRALCVLYGVSADYLLGLPGSEVKHEV